MDCSSKARLVIMATHTLGEYGMTAGSEYGYLLKSYVGMFMFALRRTRATRKDLFSWLFMLSAPLLYILGFKGELRTPVGRLLITDSRILRSFAYGFFKTHFVYLHELRALWPRRSFFPVIVDVGANLGDFTLAMRDFSGKILAVEPEKKNFLALSANLRINHVNNVVPIRLAAHDREEEVFLQGESSNMYVTWGNKGQSVGGTPLDLIIRRLGIGNIDLMKIDVQGHERFVLSGMRDLLEGKFVKLLIVEVHLKRGVSVDSIVSLMETHGYRLVHKDIYLFDQPHLYFAPTLFQSRNDGHLTSMPAVKESKKAK
jgi:FkbM family methyltransferase